MLFLMADGYDIKSMNDNAIFDYDKSLIASWVMCSCLVDLRSAMTGYHSALARILKISLKQQLHISQICHPLQSIPFRSVCKGGILILIQFESFQYPVQTLLEIFPWMREGDPKETWLLRSK